jgi:ferredoxin, 2Fe-2S
VVRVEPAGLEFEVMPGEPVAVAAWRQEYVWPTQCWGQAECMVCFAKVVSGETEVEPASEYERSRMEQLLPRQARSSTTRLACQLTIRGPGVILEKKGVKPPPDRQ